MYFLKAANIAIFHGLLPMYELNQVFEHKLDCTCDIVSNCCVRVSTTVYIVFYQGP